MLEIPSGEDLSIQYAVAIREKTDKMDYMKNKNVCIPKNYHKLIQKTNNTQGGKIQFIPQRAYFPYLYTKSYYKLLGESPTI